MKLRLGGDSHPSGAKSSAHIPSST
jgi:hypothetical protein